MERPRHAAVILYALADYSLSEHQTIETFLTREEAQAGARCCSAATAKRLRRNIRLANLARSDLSIAEAYGA